jgi:hypothetical protein
MAGSNVILRRRLLAGLSRERGAESVYGEFREVMGFRPGTMRCGHVHLVPSAAQRWGFLCAGKRAQAPEFAVGSFELVSQCGDLVTQRPGADK